MEKWTFNKQGFLPTHVVVLNLIHEYFFADRSNVTYFIESNVTYLIEVMVTLKSFHDSAIKRYLELYA